MTQPYCCPRPRPRPPRRPLPTPLDPPLAAGSSCLSFPPMAPLSWLFTTANPSVASCLATLPSVCEARGPEDCMALSKYSWEEGSRCQERYPALRRITVPDGGMMPSSGAFRGRCLRATTRGSISASKGSTSSSLCGRRQYRQTSWSPKGRVATTARAPESRISTVRRS